MSELARIETVVFLQSVDVFSYCKAEEVLRIAAIAQERSVAAGEKIYSANEPAEAMFCVVRGSVKVEPGNGETKIVGPLATFGGVDILRSRLRTTSATAETDTLLLAIESDDLFDLLSNNIEIVKALFRHLIERFQHE
ncbi:MAG: cyclic nucleotide-binding domain-containing protein [Nitrospirae bacterium]|nr:cyclic nucleotide-binding domain-containing protein [Nitrospirota bacterium]